MKCTEVFLMPHLRFNPLLSFQSKHIYLEDFGCACCELFALPITSTKYDKDGIKFIPALI
jgi:hypothetical protein